MPIDRRKLIQRLRKFGFTGPLSGGRHQFMIKGQLKVRIPNPHRGGDITDSLLKEILRQAEISTENWSQK